MEGLMERKDSYILKIDRWKDRQMERQIYGRIYRCNDSQMKGCIDGKIYMWKERQMS